MQIGIIGHGNVGGALARAWAAKGHQVLVGTRREEDEKAEALARRDGIECAALQEAAVRSEALLLATPPGAAPDLAEQLGPLEGKVVIDATNTIGPASGPYPTAFHAFLDKTRAELVKCFNTTGYENMLDPNYGALAIDMFMAGSSAQAKAVARQLALDAGFAECYDFGGEDKVILLEQLALCWINLALFQKQGRDIAFKVLKR